MHCEWVPRRQRDSVESHLSFEHQARVDMQRCWLASSDLCMNDASKQHLAKPHARYAACKLASLRAQPSRERSDGPPHAGACTTELERKLNLLVVWLHAAVRPQIDLHNNTRAVFCGFTCMFEFVLGRSREGRWAGPRAHGEE
jgi:hypothetical protein